MSEKITEEELADALAVIEDYGDLLVSDLTQAQAVALGAAQIIVRAARKQGMKF